MAAHDEARHAQGMSVRREVLGDSHVDRAVAKTTEFTEPFQDFITRYAWGELWSGDGIERPMRSCITLAILASTGLETEFAMHVRAALRNGVLPAQIREVLMHVAIYAGVPRANSAFGIANSILAEYEDAAGSSETSSESTS